jgi:hypothetical protein
VKGLLNLARLKDVRGYLEAKRTEANPVDRKARVKDIVVSFDDNTMRLGTQASLDAGKAPALITTQAASQLAGDVLPPKFWSGFQSLVPLAPDLARDVWSTFTKTRRKNRVIRLVRMRLGGEVRLVVRAVVSDVYADYSNVDCVRAIEDSSGHLASLPVVDWDLSDTGFRVRFLALDAETAMSAAFQPPELVPMVEVWNGETGGRSLGMRGGLYNVRLGYGFGHHSAAVRMPHKGKAENLAARLQAHYVLTTRDAADLFKAYEMAKAVDMGDDMEDWLKSAMEGMNGLTKGVQTAILKALTDPTVHPGSKLASVVDALIIAASQESDLWKSQEIESAASRLLKKGLLEAGV